MPINNTSHTPLSEPNASDALLKAANSGQADVVDRILQWEPKIDQTLCDEALHQANLHQHHKCVALLAPHCSEQSLNAVFKDAVIKGWVDGTKIMLEFVDSRVINVGLEWSASNNGACLDLLASVCDASMLHDTFMLLIDRENSEHVRKFLKHVDPKYNNSQALQWASQIQCQEVFDLLYPLSDPEAAHRALHSLITKREQRHGREAPGQIQMLEERMALDRLNAQLTEETQRVGSGLQREKKM